jgi:hypothetical protein
MREPFCSSSGGGGAKRLFFGETPNFATESLSESRPKPVIQRMIRSSHFVSVCFLCAAGGFLGRPTLGVELAKDGKPLASIVVPAQPLPVESYAAKELQYHVETSTGARLPIVSEGQQDSLAHHVYLGKTNAAATAKVDPSNLPGNGYLVKNAGGDLYLAGSDSSGNALDMDTRAGTLFGLYDVLENDLHVAWLWPGKLGEVIPKKNDLSLTPADATVQPLLWFKEWRGGRVEGERVWLRRQRFGRSKRPGYGHSFGKYWDRFSTTHPEFFAMLPDGTRRLEPHTDGPDWNHMCVSEPGLWKQIIDDWKAKGAGEYLNICENDGWAGCACERCLSWDEPDPENPVPFDKRLEAAKDKFEHGGGAWQLQMGSLSDRYAKFWKAVTDEAVKIRPDVTVISYAYDNYRKPPVKATLSPNVLLGFVPDAVFPYSKVESDLFRKEWLGWEKTGAKMFLRPNFTSQEPNFPAFYAHPMGEDLEFAMAHGVRGMDFDSLNSQYSAQGPTLYVLPKVLNHPKISVDAALDEFYSAFGAAKPTVKEYFEVWESIYPQYMFDDYQHKLRSTKGKYGAGTYGPFYTLAPDIYTPEVMAKAGALLEKARTQTAGDATASARVEWLGKGYQHAQLILATEHAYEHGVDTGDMSGLKPAYQSLVDFRNQNAEYDKENFAGVTVHSERLWKPLR